MIESVENRFDAACISKSSGEIQAVVAGHICLDVIPSFAGGDMKRVEEIFVPGKLVNMGGLKVSTGGPVSNTGIALSRLGIRTKLMGKIGKDFFGRGAIEFLKKYDAEDGMLIADDQETSYTIVIVPPGYDRIFLHNPGANDTFCAGDIDYDLVSRAALFHFGYPPLMKKIYRNDGEELIEIFRRVKELGVTTSLDMSLPDAASESGRVNWEKVLERLLPYVDIFLPSVEETLFMLDRQGFERLNAEAKGGDILENLDIDILYPLGERLLSLGTKIAVIKCGVGGYYIRTSEKESLACMGRALPGDIDNWAGRELQEESFHVPVIASAAGSGDSSIAGFLAAYLKGMSIEETIRIACAVGGQNVKVYDAVSGVKTWQETQAMIPGWRKNRLGVKGDYWKYNAEKSLWAGRKDAVG